MQEGPIDEYVSVTNFIKRYPMFLNLQANWINSQVGTQFCYPESVHASELYAFNGVFMELFLRKCLCIKYNIPCIDSRTETQLRYSFKSEHMKEKLFNAYQAYMNLQLDTIEIIDDIKMVALSHRLAHDEKMENIHEAMTMEVDILNLKEIMKYVDNLEYTNVICKKRCEISCGNIHLIGVPDYIFDDSVICHVSTSMRHTTYPSKVAKLYFYMLGHYSQNYYWQNIVKVYTLIIYNPLLGTNHTLRIAVKPTEFKNIQEIIDTRVRLLKRVSDPSLCY